MLQNAVPAKIVSAMLRHSSIGITMDTYSHVLTDMQEGATSKMNTLLKKAILASVLAERYAFLLYGIYSRVKDIVKAPKAYALGAFMAEWEGFEPSDGF